jgi:hypothetical protein
VAARCGTTPARACCANKAAVFSMILFGLISLVAIIGPMVWVHDYRTISDLRTIAPTFENMHILGTDLQGRDLFARLLIGLRISLLVGIVATAVSLFIGVTWGAVAGYLGGRIDNFMMRIVDVLYALPFIFFVILLLTVFERNIVLIFLAIGAIEWLTMSRIVRGQTLSIKQQGIHRGCARRRRLAPRHHPAPHPAERHRPGRCLCHADHPGGHPGGEFPLLPRSRRERTADFARRADLRRRQADGREAVDADRPGRDHVCHAALPELHRRRPAGCAGPERTLDSAFTEHSPGWAHRPAPV